ncbi:hypothetical protein HOF65_00680 [bacterium]|nr:hypothetical protein [bacterium]MBT3852560.1 hypothetical protein [bacterium]MBT4632727.1 hypothetical protein [bacterium]MBT5491774.1 hypothetical protein [bacterium]MBT6778578.1 hypothetical protein [bacterium]
MYELLTFINNKLEYENIIKYTITINDNKTFHVILNKGVQLNNQLISIEVFTSEK